MSQPRTERRRAVGVVTVLGSALSNQTGAAVGALAFPLIGPVGVVVVRQFVAAVVLLTWARPKFWRFTRQQWWPVLLLAVVFATMNLTLYFSIERIGLGLAVTLEFLGPLAIALIGSRSRGAVLCAVGAALGVVAITRPEATTDYLGVGLALTAACCWATYILVNQTVSRRIPGVQGTATATALSATGYLPVGIVLFTTNPPSLFAIVCAVGTGVLASAVPYAADAMALRHLPAQLFGVLMSINPIFAALVGLVLLGESLGWLEWIGVTLIVVANAAALTLRSPQLVEEPVSAPVS